jgi:riboflavin synthase
VTSDARPGDSIAVNGVCLTVVDLEDGSFSADVMQETLDRSSLGGLQEGSPVNLERAARVDARLGGHIVQGHVDGTATVRTVETTEHWRTISFSISSSLSRYIVEKGSISVDGVSLTVVHVDDDSFSVSLIPTTLEHTTLGMREVGDTVNIEVDVLAKYVERLLEGRLT